MSEQDPDQQWFGSLDPDPHCRKTLDLNIRIRVETDGDPHRFYRRISNSICTSPSEASSIVRYYRLANVFLSTCIGINFLLHFISFIFSKRAGKTVPSKAPVITCDTLPYTLFD
jgi:hypothetical protein